MAGSSAGGCRRRRLGWATGSASAGRQALRPLRPCRHGDFLVCRSRPSRGSHATAATPTMIAPARPWPGSPGSGADAAPLMSPVTTFNSLRHAGPGRRPGGRAGHRRARSSGRAVLRQGGLPHRGHREGQGQGAARAQAGSAPLHRQPDPGSGRGADPAGWRAGHPRDGDERQGDDGDHWRPRRGRQAGVLGAPTNPVVLRSPSGRRSVRAAVDGRSTRRTRWPSPPSPACADEQADVLEKASEAYDHMMSGKALPGGPSTGA